MPRLSLGLGVQNSRRVKSGGGTPPFSPSDLSNLKLWLKADAGVSLSSGNVTAWADQSGNGKNMTSAVNPIFVSGAKNGKPALSFTGTQYMTGAGIFNGSESRTFFVVYYTDNESSASNTICGQNNLDDSIAGSFFMMQARNDGLNSSPYFAGYASDVGNGEYVNNVWKIGSVTWDPTSSNITLFDNGTAANSTQDYYLDTYNAANCFTIGAFYEPANSQYQEFFGGKLCEIIAYNRVLTESERGQVESYLNSKYAIY